MKRKWLYIGVAVAAVLLSFFEGLWHEVVFKSSFGDFQAIQRTSPLLIFSLLSEAAFALVFGVLYLHVPNEKRSIGAGAILGTILGLLIGVSRFLDWYGSFDVSLAAVWLEILKTAILGTTCGTVISFVELKTNRRSRQTETDC